MASGPVRGAVIPMTDMPTLIGEVALVVQIEAPFRTYVWVPGIPSLGKVLHQIRTVPRAYFWPMTNTEVDG